MVIATPPPRFLNLDWYKNFRGAHRAHLLHDKGACPPIAGCHAPPIARDGCVTRPAAPLAGKVEGALQAVVQDHPLPDSAVDGWLLMQLVIAPSYRGTGVRSYHYNWTSPRQHTRRIPGIPGSAKRRVA